MGKMEIEKRYKNMEKGLIFAAKRDAAAKIGRRGSMPFSDEGTLLDKHGTLCYNEKNEWAARYARVRAPSLNVGLVDCERSEKP